MSRLMPASTPQNASQIKDVHDRTSSWGQVAHSESWYKIGKLPVALLGGLDLGGLTLLALAWRTGGDDKRLLGALSRSIFLHYVGQPCLA
jgi:hypothetical protein